MNVRMLKVLVVFVVSLGAISCAGAPPGEGAMPYGTAGRGAYGTGASRPAPGLSATPVQAEPVLPFGAAELSLTETLDRTLTGLEEVRTENARLKEKVAQLEGQLQQRDETIDRLNAQLSAGGNKIQQMEDALQKWQQDVLGFRDEMRAAEEAELTVLQKMLTLLQEFEKQREIQ